MSNKVKILGREAWVQMPVDKSLQVSIWASSAWVQMIDVFHFAPDRTLLTGEPKRYVIAAEDFRTHIHTVLPFPEPGAMVMIKGIHINPGGWGTPQKPHETEVRVANRPWSGEYWASLEFNDTYPNQDWDDVSIGLDLISWFPSQFPSFS